jgi:predicted nucleotidyltransferase/HEPN domain-containing protein
MKNSLDHLPQIKQEELKKIAIIIHDNCKTIEKIILFGSYARGDYKEEKDLKTDRKSGHVSDYDILVVTSTKEVALDIDLWEKISDLCDQLNLSAPARIITHDIVALNIKLAEGQYFYTDVKKEGIALYDSKKVQLARKRQLNKKEQKRIAQDYFDSWFTSAEDFFIDYNNAFQRGAHKKAAFYLHQAAESCYKTILLVFSNYSPNEHFLKNLDQESEQFHPALKDIFPKTTRKDQDRFKLLEYAYIGGRYDPQYVISKESLELLAKDIKKLIDLTKKICKEKIDSLNKTIF